MGSGVGKPNGDQTTHNSAASRASTSTTTGPPSQSGQGLPRSSENAPSSPPQGLRPSTSSQQQTDDAEMVCEACSANFTIFKRKHRCLDCDKFFCANCIHKEPRKCCHACRVFETVSTRGDVMQVKLKYLRQYLLARNISIETCREKDDLVDLVIQHLGLPIAPHILPLANDHPSRDLPGQQRESETTSATSTSADTIPITEPNSSTRPNQTSGTQESTGHPSVHIYGETPLGPMRHAWNDDSPEAQSEASPVHSQGMDDSEFPEIINIPNQENTESTTSTSQSQQQSQVTGESPAAAPASSTDTHQGNNSDAHEQSETAQASQSVPSAPASNNTSQGSTQAGTQTTQATEANPNLTKKFGQRSEQHSSHVTEGQEDFPVFVNIPQDQPSPEPKNNDTVQQQIPTEQAGAEELSQAGIGEPIQIETPWHQTFTDPSSTEEVEAETSTEVPRRPRERASVSDIKTALDIESLSIKQLKEILARNFVDYKGCVERYELEERVTRLFNEKESFRQKEEKVAAEKNDGNAPAAEDIFDVDPEICCKICMDAPIDCVLLECGHMVTCSKCGKRLAECPICRQYVVRAVHVFKS